MTPGANHEDAETQHEPAVQVVAAGGVVCLGRAGLESFRVLVVHRPRYDDWSFPKGKAEAGETPEQTALREVLEETSLECRIVREMKESHYQFESKSGKTVRKVVHYYLMEPCGGAVAVQGDEVDRAEWLNATDAERRLTYDADRELLGQALSLWTGAGAELI